ncbi:outer membrane protein assembly factor BamC [Aeromonas simiae]|uniref:outer membrane protein assembly factor BamC n=1 Tax=Aeromonas simiae TaxID=218936 RepID=UPI00266D717F|nr:outer membrane protein assembly factor BamC [Aeromonas simiae]MDO2947613.1 outer membrane protein assembly factor BamC [Aeromonas simiae]MDO2955173.1 outer membrane protein assembly factor BamC [Aeromonas simiae]
MSKANGRVRTAGLALLSLAVVAGCSSPAERKMANRGFDYEEAKLEGRAFLVPAGLQAPRFSSDYDVPPLPEGNREGPVGAAVDVRPPAQLLTVVPGSQVVQSSGDPTVSFYALSTSQDVSSDAWAFLMNFLAKYKVTTEQLDRAAGTLETGWFSNTAVLDGWGEEDDDFQIRQRYLFSLKADPVRHGINVTAKVVEHEEIVDGETRTTLSDAEARRYAVRALNQFSLYYDQQIKARDQHKSTEGMGLALGFDNNDLSAWVADAPFDQVWQRMNRMLPRYGFTIKDSQQSLGWIDVEYDDPGKGFWSGIGGEPFKLEEGKYRFQLGEMAGGKTSITLFDEDKKPVKSDVVSQMHITLSQAFAKALAEQSE